MKIKNVEITNSELVPFIKDRTLDTLNNKVSALFHHQLTPDIGFPTLIQNMKNYKESISSYIKINGITFRIFYNPTRKNNVKANTFTDNNNNFNCFLCDLLPGQKGIKYLDGKYMIIVNPGITIPGDLTIPTIKHKKQILKNHFPDMLVLAKELNKYSIYFNGPMAGATCPHFHFQAGIRDNLPAEISINNILQSKYEGTTSKQYIFKNYKTKIFRIDNFLRTTYACYTSSKNSAIEFGNTMFDLLKIIDQKHIQNIQNVPNFGSFIKLFEENETEARFNVMTKYYPNEKKYLIVFFPKLFNRPQVYFTDESTKIILGFAIKEALGHVLTASEQDMHRILDNPNIIYQAYIDTSITNVMDNELFKKILDIYKIKKPDTRSG